MTNSTPQAYSINYISTDNYENNLTFVRMLYNNILDRTGDQNGVNFWTAQLNDHKITRDQLITKFFDSPEIQNQFQTPADAVTNVYRSLLLREPDKDGLDFWTNKIGAGASKISDIAVSLVHSAEFTKIQDKTTLPIVNTIWEDQASWDSITAEQLAQLIAYNPNGDGQYFPNKNLNFIVSGLGPKSTAHLSDSAHYYTQVTTDPHTQQPVETQISLASQIYMNPQAGQPSAADPKYLVSFIKAVSDEVARLTNNQVSWATNAVGSTGSVGYHPDTTTYGYSKQADGTYAKFLDYANDWAGFQIPGGSTFASVNDLPNAYKAFLDYTTYLNTGLKQAGLKGFSQLIFETEGTYPDMSKPDPSTTVPYPDVYPTSSYTDPQLVYPHVAYGDPPWEKSLFNLITNYVKNNDAWQVSGNPNGIVLAATSAPIVNMSYWGAAQSFAQVYDLYNDTDDYSKTPWLSPDNIDPSKINVATVVSDFATFFANTNSGATPLNPKGLNEAGQIYNARYMLNDPVNPTKYIPTSTFVFSYGPGDFKTPDETKDQPIFQYGSYILSNDASHSYIPNPYIKQSNSYYWNAADFTQFASTFGQALSTNLNTITKGSFPSNLLPSIGVWGGERALDAWIGYVDLPTNKSSNLTTDIKTISNGGSVSLQKYIDDIYQSLIGRIPTTAESDTLSTVALSTLNPATKDKVTLTAEAAIINSILKTPSVAQSHLSDDQFIDHLYTDVLGRHPDQNGAQYHQSLLQTGISRSQLTQNIITSKEFTDKTGFNFQNSLFASQVNVLWQDDPQSWIKAVDPNSAQKIASLMQGNPNFTLVLDFLPEYSTKVLNDQAWSKNTLVPFLNDLKKYNLTPTILFHPDATQDDAGQWFPSGVVSGDATFQMANWMASLNKDLLKSGISSDYLLKGMVGEGSLLQKDWSTYSVFNTYYKVAAQNLGLPTQNIQLWDTGDWRSDNTLASPTPVINGTFVQLYDFWKTNTLFKILPQIKAGYPLTDPNMAAVIGNELLTSLLPPATDTTVNTQLLKNPKGTIWTLNFSGTSTGSNSDAPVFGKGADVTATWDINSINTLLSSLSDEAQLLYPSPKTPTQIAIWSAESLLDYLVPVTTTGFVAH